jgi:hypothetical protein
MKLFSPARCTCNFRLHRCSLLVVFANLRMGQRLLRFEADLAQLRHVGLVAG